MKNNKNRIMFECFEKYSGSASKLISPDSFSTIRNATSIKNIPTCICIR